MEVGLRSRLVLLQLWCGVLSVAVVVIAALITTTTTTTDRQKTTPTDTVSTVRPNVDSAPAQYFGASPGAKDKPPTSGQSQSYIQLISWQKNTWILDSEIPEDHGCNHCSLLLHNNSIQCQEEGLYLVYAGVHFLKNNPQNRSVTVMKNGSKGKSPRGLVQAPVSESQEWVSVFKIVSLQWKDSVSIEISGDYSTKWTFWGMVQLQMGHRPNV